MKAIGPAFCLVLAVAPGVSAQTDRMVPSANYPTLQAAVNASVAGDRIVLADGHSESGPILINKPLTIEAVVGGTATFFLYTPNYSCPFGGSGNACFGINTTDPSVPLILRRVAFSLAEMGGDTYGLVANVAGEARFENVSFNHGGGYHGSSGPTLRLTASTVWMKNVTFTAANRVWDYACWDSDRGGGVSCLDVQAGKLVMEGCSLSAGSAAQYMSHPDGCYSCYQAPYVHFPRGGGNAIYANTQLTVLTRCSFSDGNGSGATNPNAPGICPTSAPAGAPGTSSFTGPSGTLIAHASQHERGIAGGAGGFRGGFLPIGSPLAPLTTDGNASPGGTLAIQIGQVPNNLALLLLTVGWDANPTPIGTLPVSIAATLWSTAVTTPWSTNIAVPNLPSLRYLPIASQVYWFDPDIQIGNASGTWIDRR